MRMSSEIRGLGSSPKSISSDFRFLDNSGEWKTLFESTENAGKNNHVRFSKQERMSKALRELHLDLFNFEEPNAQHSRYVLTSPRSLEACGRFAIKPVELLHKSFEEFVEEYKSLYDTEYSHRAVYEVFKEHERQRLRKLKLCRDERERIIKAMQGDQTILSGRDYRPEASHTLRNHLLKSPRSPGHDNKDTDVIEESGFVTRKGDKDNRWTSSSRDFDNYHDTRTTSPVWNNGTVSVRGKETRLSRKPPSGQCKHSYAAVKSRTTSPRVPKTYGESSDSDEGGNTCIPRTQALRGSWSAGSDTEDHSPRTSKKPSSAGSLGKRNGFIRRTVSMDSIESLNSAGTAGLSEKDQRIVNLMVSRHEEQQRARKERLMLDLEMAQQKKLEEQLRQARHRQRQAEIYDRYKAKDLKQCEVRARRFRNEHRLRQGRKETLLSKDFSWQMERRKQEHLKNNKLLTKKIKDAETKRKQEENLWQKEREDELQRNMIQLNLLDKHKSAIMNKNQQFTQQHMRIRSRNEKVQDRYRWSSNRLGQQLREQEENSRHEVAAKHQTALMNYQRQLSRKENQMAMSKIKREERIERQQEQLKKKHDDLEEWQKELTEFRKQKDRRALDTAAMTVVSKQQKVRAQLMAKKEDHLQNYEKVKQADEERKRSIQEIIEIKDDRSKVVNTEKEEVKRVNRDAARTSQAVRDIVREQTLRSSFDRMAEAAERQAFVGRGPQTGHKNKSTLRLG